MKTCSIPNELFNKQFISPKELTKILDVSLPTIYRLVYTRKIPVYKVRKSLRFMKEDVIAYLTSNKLDPIQ